MSLESRLLLKKGTANSLSLGATRPCKGDCIITQIATSIEWDDGRTATAKEGVRNSRSIANRNADADHVGLLTSRRASEYRP